MRVSVTSVLFFVISFINLSHALTCKATKEFANLRQNIDDVSHFCAFWRLGQRKHSPFSNLSVISISRACACVPKANDHTSPPSSFAITCTPTDPSIRLVRRSLSDPRFFCKYWRHRSSRGNSPFSTLSAAAVSQVCRCAAKKPSVFGGSSKTTFTAQPTTTSKITKSKSGSSSISASASPAVSKIPAPPPIQLAPVIPPTIDRTKLINLAPVEKQELIYASPSGPSSNTTAVASVSASMFHPSVNLDYSAYVSSASCTNNTLTVAFTSEKSMDFAKAQWTSSLPVVLITSSASCGSSGSNANFVVESVSFSTLTLKMTAKGSLGKMKDLVKEMDLNFGTADTSPSNDTAGADVGQNMTASGFVAPNQNWDKSGLFALNTDIDTVNKHGSYPLVKGPWGVQPQILNIAPTATQWAVIFAALQALQIFSIGVGGPPQGIRAYCVNCLASVRMTAVGSVSTSYGKVTKAEMNIKGNINANVNLGLDAYMDIDIGVGHDFVEIGLPGLCIPFIYCFGPAITVGVGAGIELQASAKALIQGTMVWPNMNVFIDGKNPRNSRINGPKPQVKGKLDVTGSVTATASISLPIGIGIGVEILEYFDVSAQFVVEPGVAISSTYTIDVTASNTNGKPQVSGNINGIKPGDTYCAGVNWQEYGFVKQSFEVLKLSIPISEYDYPPFASGCIGRLVTWPKPTPATTKKTTTTTKSTTTKVTTTTASPTPSATLRCTIIQHNGLNHDSSQCVDHNGNHHFDHDIDNYIIPVNNHYCSHNDDNNDNIDHNNDHYDYAHDDGFTDYYSHDNNNAIHDEHPELVLDHDVNDSADDYGDPHNHDYCDDYNHNHSHDDDYNHNVSDSILRSCSELYHQ
ncbi:Hypothetical protein D9617_30g011660 [Elsinoe fawcettii]|nr:Hypothetical protein D9617_30g011660 [Elsinoe fawcettii]